MKKLSIIVLCVLLTVMLAACSTNTGAAESPAASTGMTEQSAPASSGQASQSASEAATSNAASAPASAAEGPTGDGGYYNVGDTAIDFELPLLSGQTVKLSSLKGKPVVLNFWATWCGYCVEELPQFEKLSKDLDGKATVLALNVGDDEQTVSEFIKSAGYTMNVVLDTQNSLAQNYPVNIIPYTLVLDADGKVVFTNLGARDDMEEAITKALNM